MTDGIFSFSATETGYNHLKIDKVCEDYSGFYDDKSMHICVVSDGHGSDNYPRTDRGSKLAVEATIKCVKNFVENAVPNDVLNDEKNNYDLMMQLAKSILLEWHQAVEEDFSNNPFSDDELVKVSEKYKIKYLSENQEERNIQKAYGCTLIVFTETDQYSFGLQIGDGKCVTITDEGDSIEPIPWDENCQLNVTTSICDSDAIDEFRYYISKSRPVAVFCGSDGIDDSYANSEELYALYRSILKIFIEHGRDVGQNEIKEYLPVLTKRGSGDDVSISTIIDLPRLKQLAKILELRTQIFQKNEEKKEVTHSADVTREQRNNLRKKVSSFLNDKGDIGNDAIIKFKELGDEAKEKEWRLVDIDKEIETLERQIQLELVQKQTEQKSNNCEVDENIEDHSSEHTDNTDETESETSEKSTNGGTAAVSTVIGCGRPEKIVAVNSDKSIYRVVQQENAESEKGTIIDSVSQRQDDCKKDK